jgi:glycerophosphoryl diester phosphodiesterase
MHPTRPLILAHRGASAQLPENTLPAFVRALELGADGVELDVHETDGGLVVHHDPDAPAGLAAGRPAKHGGVIPSLDAVLAELAAIRPGATVFVEVKTLRDWSVLARCLAPYRDRIDLEVQSFDPDVLRGAPAGWPLGLIADAPPADPIAALARLGARTLSLRHTAADAVLAEQLHSSGNRLSVWTVNAPDRALGLAELQIDVLITDDPARITPRFRKP